MALSDYLDYEDDEKDPLEDEDEEEDDETEEEDEDEKESSSGLSDFVEADSIVDDEDIEEATEEAIAEEASGAPMTNEALEAVGSALEDAKDALQGDDVEALDGAFQGVADAMQGLAEAAEEEGATIEDSEVFASGFDPSTGEPLESEEELDELRDKRKKKGIALAEWAKTFAMD